MAGNMNKILLSTIMVGLMLLTGTAIAQIKKGPFQPTGLVPAPGEPPGNGIFTTVGSGVGRGITRAIGLFRLFNFANRPTNSDSFSAPAGDRPNARGQDSSLTPCTTGFSNSDSGINGGQNAGGSGRAGVISWYQICLIKHPDNKGVCEACRNRCAVHNPDYTCSIPKDGCPA